jgi:hypothetical protein
LDVYSVEDVKSAIDNYDTICAGTGEYFWTHRGWTFFEFLERGLNRFVPDAKPLTNFLKTDLKNKKAPGVSVREVIAERERQKAEKEKAYERN